MKENRFYFVFFIFFFLCVGITAWVSPSWAKPQPIVLRYANFPPASTFPCVQMERWKEEVEKQTNGRIKIETFPSGTILNARAMMDGILQRQADIGVVCMAYQPGRFVVTNGIAVPLNIPNATVGSQVLWKLIETYSPDEFKDVVVLAAFTTAPINLMTKMPIRSFADISRQSIRASGSAAQILKKWGANAVGMPMPDTAEAIQKGVVKGLFSSLEILKDMKFAETCKYITYTNTVVYPFAVIMNRNAWNSLPADIQKIFMALAPEQSRWTGAYMDQHVMESVEWSIQTQGVKQIFLSPTEKEKFRAALAPITQTWRAQMTKKGLSSETILNDIKRWIQLYHTKEIHIQAKES